MAKHLFLGKQTKPQAQYLISTEGTLWTDVLGSSVSLIGMELCMGDADATSTCYAQIMSAEKFDFNYDGHFSLSS